MLTVTVYKTTYPPPVDGEDYCPDGEVDTQVDHEEMRASEAWRLVSELGCVESSDSHVSLLGVVGNETTRGRYCLPWLTTVDDEPNYSTGEVSRYSVHIDGPARLVRAFWRALKVRERSPLLEYCRRHLTV